MQLRTFTLLISLVWTAALFGQVPAYYNGSDLNLTGAALRSELADLITTTQTTNLSYTPGVWNALKQTDLDPNNSSRVVLVYGFSDTDGVTNTDRTRSVNSNGGGTTDWNREHVYPKSLGQPNLGTSGPGADVHHLRPSDVSRNSSRGSRKFADGSGNSAITNQGHWYPGDEFKGDVARMVMYMYLRYGNRCLPNNVGIGGATSSDNNMLNLFLEWNAEDPVSTLELQRNPIVEGLQGNRNPFIDNPAFATVIWGGPQAEDRFGGNSGGGGNENPLCSSTVTSFPYAESFEGDFGAWVQAGTDDFNWARRSGTTPSSGTGPSSANDGSSYIYMESSTPNYSTKRAILYGPCYALPASGEVTFSFKYHLYGASNMGSLALEASLDGTSWSSVWSKSGNQGNSWQTAEVNLSAYLGESVQLRLNGVTGTTWQGDMAVDALALSTGGGGGGNSDVAAQLRITFDNYPEETSWDLKNSSGSIVYSGGTYGSQADGSTITIPTPLGPDCYTLTFRDTYGDGICCSYGNGSYALTQTSNGDVLASGGSFGSQDVKTFCVTSSLLSDGIINGKQVGNYADFLLYPNPAKDVLFIEATKEADYQVFSQSGQLLLVGKTDQRIDLKSLPAGTYVVRVTDKEVSTAKLLVKE